MSATCDSRIRPANGHTLSSVRALLQDLVENAEIAARHPEMVTPDGALRFFASELRRLVEELPE